MSLSQSCLLGTCSDITLDLNVTESCLLGTCSDITLDLNVTESVMPVRNVQRYHIGFECHGVSHAC